MSDNNSDTTLEIGAKLPANFFEELPKPLFWRILILPRKPKEVSAGGIYIPKVNQDAQEILTYMGQVVAMGPHAGVHERLGGDGTTPAPDFPKVNDFVMYGKYAGQTVVYKGVKLILVNDDELLGTLPSPEALTIRI